MLCSRVAGAVTDERNFLARHREDRAFVVRVGERPRAEPLSRKPIVALERDGPGGDAAEDSASSAARLQSIVVSLHRPQLRGLIGVMPVQVLQEPDPSIVHPRRLVKDVDGNLASSA